MRALLPRRGERAQPLLSAVLLAASYPPLHPLVLPFVGLVPVALFVAARGAGAAGAASARRGGALFGAVHFGIVLYWVPIALAWLSPAGIGVYVIGLGLFGVAGAAFGHVLHHAVHRVRAPVWLALPVAWTALEWGLAHVPGGVAYPWLGLGTTLTGFPPLVGIAELVGARGVGFWIALVNGLLARSMLARGEAVFGRAGAAGAASPGAVGSAAGSALGPAVWLVAVVGVSTVPMAWGVWRASTLETWPVARVALLQTNLPQSVRMDPAGVRDATYAALDRLVGSVEPGSVDVAVAPEMLLPIVPTEAGTGEAAFDTERLRAYARELGAPLLFGALGSREDAGAWQRLNSVYLVEPRGLADFRWDKHHLVPLVERSLLLSARLRPPVSTASGGDDFGVGRGWPLADAAGVGFGTMVCFESAFPEVARGLRRAGADVLVNVTNDAWFGDDVGAARTAATWQHPAHLVMRAIETRSAVVRVGNAGFSFWVDPVGRTHGVIDAFTEGAGVVEVTTSDVDTVFVRFGDLLGNASGLAGLVLLLLGFAGAAGRERPERREGTGPP